MMKGKEVMETTKQHVIIGGELANLPVILTFQVGNGGRRITQKCLTIDDCNEAMRDAHVANWNLLTWREVPQ